MGSHTMEYTVKEKEQGGEERREVLYVKDIERFPRSVAQFKRKSVESSVKTK